MTKQRRKFSPAEKAKIALAAIKGDMTIAEVVSKYSVHATQVNKWEKQALAQLREALSGKQKQLSTDHASGLSELYEQIGRLKVENAFLKKVRLTRYRTVRLSCDFYSLSNGCSVLIVSVQSMLKLLGLVIADLSIRSQSERW